MPCRLGPRPWQRVLRKQKGRNQCQDNHDQAEAEQTGSRIKAGRKIACDQPRKCYTAVPGKFIDPGCKAALIRTDNVDLAGDRHRPGESLVDTQQHIGGDDPVPGRRVEKYEGDRERDEPAPDQHATTTYRLRKAAGHEIHCAFDEAEADNKCHQQRSGTGRHAELRLGEDRHNGSLHADRQANKEYLGHLLDELAEIVANALNVTAHQS